MKCIRCGNDVGTARRICQSCMGNWLEMRKTAYDFLVSKHGEMTAENHPIFKKEMPRLERIWRKDRNAFEAAITAPQEAQ